VHHDYLKATSGASTQKQPLISAPAKVARSHSFFFFSFGFVWLRKNAAPVAGAFFSKKITPAAGPAP
jgi:hypothetical protein